MFPTALLVIVSCALVAQAQSTTTATAPASQSSVPAGLDDCILGCVTPAAASAGCSSYTDLACVCTSSAFQQTAAACLLANCTAADQATAAQLQTAECAAVTGNVSTSTAPSTATSSGTPSASAATSSSAAMAFSAPFSFGTVIGTLVTSAGVLVGAAFVL